MKKYFGFISDAFNKLKFVRKIQGGFLALAFISTIIAFASYYFLHEMGM
jgi:CHASE3 domain sensor protein